MSYKREIWGLKLNHNYYEKVARLFQYAFQQSMSFIFIITNSIKNFFQFDITRFSFLLFKARMWYLTSLFVTFMIYFKSQISSYTSDF